MREFPELKAFPGLSPIVVDLYNELRAAYLDVEEENRILKAKSGEYVKVRDPSKINVADLLDKDPVSIRDPAQFPSDPRLPGERRVPMAAGLYLARYEADTEWLHIVEVYGSAPYLQLRWAAEATASHIDWTTAPALPRSGSGPISTWMSLFFGPRLAGPGWRKIVEEVKA